MFAKKNGVKLKKPIISKKKDAEVIKFFEKREGFTSWSDFETRWDIGFGDDVVAQANREEKWFLSGKDKTEIVPRPDNYWEKEAARKNTSTHDLFSQECHQRGITMPDFFNLFFNSPKGL